MSLLIIIINYDSLNGSPSHDQNSAFEEFYEGLIIKFKESPQFILPFPWK